MTWKSSLTIVATSLILTGTAAAQTPGAPSSPGLPTPGAPPAPTPAPTPRPPSGTTPGTPGTTVPPSISDPGRTSPTFPCGPGQVRQPGSTACGPPVPGAPTMPK